MSAFWGIEKIGIKINPNLNETQQMFFISGYTLLVVFSIVLPLFLLLVYKLASERKKVIHLLNNQAADLEKKNQDLENEIIVRQETTESLRKLSLAIEQSPVSVMITDLNGTIEYVNPRFIESTGYTLVETLGKKPNFLKSGKTSKSLYEELWITILAGKIWSGEILNKKKNGDFIWESISISPMINEEKKLTHFISVMEDITQKKHSEEKLIRYQKDLENMAAARTAELSAAKQQAENANQAKSEFLANITHELRTPMHAILRSAEKGRDRFDSDSQERKLQRFTQIFDSGHRLLSLINDILDLSKLEAQKMHFNMNDTDLKEVVNAAINVLIEFIPDDKIRFEGTSLDMRAQFDDNKILQVVLNLLSNALKFTPPDKHITLAYSETLLPGRRGDDPNQPGICLKVIDEGIGIPAEDLESIFDKFTQSSKTKTKAGGTGLGLAICKEIVSSHRGLIYAEQNPEGGSIFTLQLLKQQLKMKP